MQKPAICDSGFRLTVISACTLGRVIAMIVPNNDLGDSPVSKNPSISSDDVENEIQLA
jgi:hypothetical protein